ncbi:Hypp2583 [Branchiostoma lanceolatum]|uniref:Hypp2583 protein n=1 Tax=Branchiostoma lanceolatum TaxID=7740 RepID=A0A8J9ZSL6_BRALA|nr:Hypp2583 [Branchiostoma lanceolatum]
MDEETIHNSTQKSMSRVASRHLPSFLAWPLILQLPVVRVMGLSMVLISYLSVVLIMVLSIVQVVTMACISHVVLLLCVFHTALYAQGTALPSECLDACTICSRTFSSPGRYFHPMRCSMGYVKCAEDLKKGYTDNTEWVLCRETMREYGLWTYR